ncbi:MAG: hypothetical protein U1E23_14930 [Reyranellaceae bacterium]
MKMTIESTKQIVTIETREGGRVPARVWLGVTDGGVECQLLIAQIAVHREADNSAFERELDERPPKPMEGQRAFDPRFFLD